jgi:hypothetical protein
MGGGCVGRSWRGDFEPGLILPNGRGQAPVVPANQFSVFIEPDGGTARVRHLVCVSCVSCVSCVVCC